MKQIIKIQTDPGILESMRVLEVDAKQLTTGKSNLNEVVARLKGAWDTFDRAEDITFIGRGEVIHLLSTTILDEKDPLTNEPLVLWQKTAIGLDEETRDELPIPVDWKSYVRQHLRISPSHASNLKRNYEVYHVKLGLSYAQMLRAGVGKLTLARSLVEKHIQAVPAALLEALVGNKMRCANCANLEPGSTPPLLCTKCGKAFVSKPPGTYGELEILVQQFRQTATNQQQYVLSGVLTQQPGSITIEWDVSNGLLAQPLPAYTIPILDNQAMGEGIPKAWLDDVLPLLHRLAK